MAMSIKRNIIGEKMGAAYGTIEFVLQDNELSQAYFECINFMREHDRSCDYKQWIADLYHCSSAYGEKKDDIDMLMTLAESRRMTDPFDYVPDITLYHECAAYWNELCTAYPN